MQRRKTYVVYRGRRSGFYATWEECQEQVDGFSGAVYRSFPTREEDHSDWLRYWARLGAQRAAERHDVGVPRANGGAVLGNEGPNAPKSRKGNLTRAQNIGRV
ncbi:Ribosomal protein L9/RNase H1, N-terminal [Sesbania bispinosa]|nr:Ribosomal protein L9/RNase H1, N-terminal [Sesbania bispinosa]